MEALKMLGLPESIQMSIVITAVLAFAIGVWLGSVLTNSGARAQRRVDVHR